MLWRNVYNPDVRLHKSRRQYSTQEGKQQLLQQRSWFLVHVLLVLDHSFFKSTSVVSFESPLCRFCRACDLVAITDVSRKAIAPVETTAHPH